MGQVKEGAELTEPCSADQDFLAFGFPSLDSWKDFTRDVSRLDSGTTDASTVRIANAIDMASRTPAIWGMQRYYISKNKTFKCIQSSSVH